MTRSEKSTLTQFAVGRGVGAALGERVAVGALVGANDPVGACVPQSFSYLCVRGSVRVIPQVEHLEDATVPKRHNIERPNECAGQVVPRERVHVAVPVHIDRVNGPSISR